MDKLTHINQDGFAKMVDVSDKTESERTAKAYAKILMSEEALTRVRNGSIKKGDVLAVAQVGGIMGAKKTSDIIPMCHNIFISGCDINFNFCDDGIEIFVVAKTFGKTGIEMEVLTGAGICALTIYDMCKAVDKKMIISEIRLLEKTK